MDLYPVVLYIFIRIFRDRRPAAGAALPAAQPDSRYLELTQCPAVSVDKVIEISNLELWKDYTDVFNLINTLSLSE